MTRTRKGKVRQRVDGIGRWKSEGEHNVDTGAEQANMPSKVPGATVANISGSRGRSHTEARPTK